MEAASDQDFGIEAAKLTLAGHGGDPRSLLAYFFACEFKIMQSNRLYAGLAMRLFESADFVSDDDAAEFARIMEHEPFSYRIFTRQLSDVQALAQCEDATVFLELFFVKFAR